MQRKMAASMFSLVALVALCGLVTSGCKKALDFSKYGQQATELVQRFTPQLQSLSAKLPELLERANDLPDSVPGAAVVKGLLAKNQDAARQLQGLIAGLTAKVGSAVKTGKADEVQKTIDDETTKIGEGITRLRVDLDASTSELARAEAAAAAVGATAPVAAVARQFAKTLASGVEITGATDGIEGQLIAFLEDAGRAVDRTTWFNFDRLTFQTGKAALDLAKSKDQLANIGEILKAYPAVKLKVGGYTDNVGKAEANKQLSQQRAQAVVAALVAGGIARDRLESEGYGPEHPVCAANDTDDCKAKNRRIAISVRAK